MTDPPPVTEDRFLGGRVSVAQPSRGYRAGVDPVLLAAAVAAEHGQSVLDLGCGAGVASLCLAARIEGLDLVGLEIQPDYAALARRNAVANATDLTVVEGDVGAMPAQLRRRSFDHVMLNPPYYRRSRGTASTGGRETALGEILPLAAWIDAAVRRLAPKGRMSAILKADRLPDLLTACDDRLGDLRLLPVTSRAGQAADRVILSARKGARGPFRLLSPLVLHEGHRHTADGESYRPEIRDVLRNGARLPVDWR